MKTINVLSLGAGVQSSTMALMVAHGELPSPDYIIFSDTGWEPAPVYGWLKGFLIPELEKYGITVTIASRGNIKEDLERAVETGSRFASIPYFIKNEDGSQGLGRRQCTKEYKIESTQKKVRELLGYKPRQHFRSKEQHVNLWFGISTDEFRRCKLSKEKWQTNVYPLIDKDMSREDCIDWMLEHGYPQPPKSACVCCPYRKNSEWALMQKLDPASFEEAVEFDKKIRDGMPGLNGQAFLHRSMKPLDEVDFGEVSDWDYVNMYQFDCEGMCGV